MKKILIISAVVAMAFSSCGGGLGSSLKSDTDSLSYALGTDLGNYLKGLGVENEIDVNIFVNAINDALEGNSKISQDDYLNFLQDYFMVRRPAKELAASIAYLEDVAKNNPNVKKTESGLMYEIIEEGDANVKAVSDEDAVRVIYEGTLRNGKVFDSSKERGDTAQFVLNRVIKGWSEGMKLVGKGGKIILYLPSDLAYGEQGQGSIGPNQALRFEVELLDVIPSELVIK